MNIPDWNDTSQWVIVNGKRVTLEELQAEVGTPSVDTVNTANKDIAQAFHPGLTDEELARMGYSAEEIQLLREG